MNAKLAELARRRAVLAHKSERQRRELAQAAAPLKKTLALADKGVQAVRYLRHHPAMLVAGVTIAAAIFPKGALRWMRRGWLVWQAAAVFKRRILPDNNSLPGD